jgi:pyruvate/2-oxoglutarate dehydrogenase complex dihydrolipoamide acyltransferase (E2) component
VQQLVPGDDQIAIASTMTLPCPSTTGPVDGATAAGFLTRLRKLIEYPLDIVRWILPKYFTKVIV